MDETGCGLIQLKSEGFFEKKLREDKDGGLILWKLKVLFVNFLQPVLLDCGLISRKAEGFFAKFPERGTWTAGWFLLSSRIFFAKWPKKARSGPSARPIRRPGTAGDVACFPGICEIILQLVAHFFIRERWLY